MGHFDRSFIRIIFWIRDHQDIILQIAALFAHKRDKCAFLIGSGVKIDLSGFIHWKKAAAGGRDQLYG